MNKPSKRTRGSNINQQEYQAIKDLLQAGVSAKMVVVATRRSPVSVHRIKKSQDFANFRQAKNPAKLHEEASYLPDPRDFEPIDVISRDDEILLVLSNINDSLDRINKRLKSIETNNRKPFWRS